VIKVVWPPTPDHDVDDVPFSVVKPVRAQALFDAIATAAGRSDYARSLPSDPLPQFAADALAVLLVEDHDGNRQIAKLMLQELGLQADEAATGLEAIARAAERRYDVILMDLQMPGLDGLEATRRILAMRQDPAPVMVAMTASVTTTDEQRCRAAGLSIFLPKPVQLDALADVLATLVASVRP
jgi:CheY-like chemotaxis protein